MTGLVKPTVGSDNGTWGDVVNDALDYLDAETRARMRAVTHGSTAGMARPTSTVPVLWIGSVAPSNAIDGDLWFDSGKLLLKLRKTGTFQTAGAPTYTTTGVNPADALVAQVSNDQNAYGHSFRVGGNVFNGQYDPISGWGYNFKTNGVPEVASEPSLAWQVEGHWYDGTTHWIESYLQFVSADGATVSRPFSTVVDRVSSIVKRTSLQGEIVRMNIDRGPGVAPVTAAEFQRGRIDFYPDTGMDFTFYLHSVAGRATTFKIGKNGVDGVGIFGVNDDHSCFIGTRGTSAERNIAFFYGSFDRSSFSVGIGDNGAAGTFRASAVDHTGIVARAFSALQINNLLEIQTSGQAILSRFDCNGYFMTRKVAPPVDSALVNSEVSFWLDDTAGAARLMIKAKDSGGTVRTAAVALA